MGRGKDLPLEVVRSFRLIQKSSLSAHSVQSTQGIGNSRRSVRKSGKAFATVNGPTHASSFRLYPRGQEMSTAGDGTTENVWIRDAVIQGEKPQDGSRRPTNNIQLAIGPDPLLRD